MTLALEELVRAELREQLRPLVEGLSPAVIAELVHERVGALNGEAEPELGSPAPGAKACVGCHQTNQPSEFEQGRGKCRRCRRAEHQERLARRQAENGNGSETAPAVATGPFV